MAKSGDDNVDLNAYILNKEIKSIENPNSEATAHDYQKALFYMYGHCEEVYDPNKDKSIMAHSILKQFAQYRESDQATKILSK